MDYKKTKEKVLKILCTKSHTDCETKAYEIMKLMRDNGRELCSEIRTDVIGGELDTPVIKSVADEFDFIMTNEWNRRLENQHLALKKIKTNFLKP